MERSKGAHAAAWAEGSGLLHEVEQRVALTCAPHGYRSFPLEFVFVLDSFQYIIAPGSSSKSRGLTTVTMTARMLCSYDPQAAATAPTMQGLSAYLVTTAAPNKEMLFTDTSDRFIKLVKMLLLSWATSAAGQAYRAAAPPAVAASITSSMASHTLSESQVKAWREAGYAAVSLPALPAVPLSGRKRARAYSSADDMGSSTDAAVAPPRRSRRRLNDDSASAVGSGGHLQVSPAGEEEGVVGSPSRAGAASTGASPARPGAGAAAPRTRGDTASLRVLASLEMSFPREGETEQSVGCTCPAPIVTAFPGIPARLPVTRSEDNEDEDDPGAASGAWCALLAAEEALTAWYRAVQTKAAATAAAKEDNNEDQEEGGSSSGSGLTVAGLRAVLDAAAQPSPEATQRMLGLAQGKPASSQPASSSPSATQGSNSSSTEDPTNKAMASRLVLLSHLPAFSAFVKHRTGGASPLAAARRALEGGDGGSAGLGNSSGGGGPADASHEKRGYETPLLAAAWRAFKSVRGLDPATQLQLEALSKSRLLRSYAVAPLEVRDDQDAGLLPALLGAHFPSTAGAGRTSPAPAPAPASSGAEVADPLAYYPLSLSECITAAGAYETGNPVVPPVARYTTLSKDRIMQVTHNADAVGAAVARGRPAPPLAPWLGTPSQQRLFEASVWACRYWNALAYHVPARIVEEVLAELVSGLSTGSDVSGAGAAPLGAHIPAHFFCASDCIGPSTNDTSSSSGSGEGSDSSSVLTLPGTHGVVPQPETAMYLLSRLVVRASNSGWRRALVGPPLSASAADNNTSGAVSSRGPSPLALARAAPAANALAHQLMTTYPWLEADPGTFRLRLATEADCGSILRLITELAVFEGQDTVANTVETLQRDGFGPEPCFYVILVEVPANVKRRLAAARAVAEASSSASTASLLPDTLLPGALREGEVHNMYCNTSDTYPYETVGMAFMHPSYSTWEGRTLYLEDLYITPAFRRYGLGSLLVRAAATVARVSGCQRLQWSCLQWNTGAMAMYRSPAIDATQLTDWTLFRLESPGLSHASGLGGVPGVAELPGSWLMPTGAGSKAGARRQSGSRGPRGADLSAAFLAVLPDPALFPAAAAAATAAVGGAGTEGEEPPPRSPARAPAWDAGSQSGDSAVEDEPGLAQGALRRYSGGAWRDPFSPPPDVLQRMGGEGDDEEGDEDDHDFEGDSGDEGGGGGEEGDGSHSHGGYNNSRLRQSSSGGNLQHPGPHRSTDTKHPSWLRDMVEGQPMRGSSGDPPAGGHVAVALVNAPSGGRAGPSNRARRQIEAAGVTMPQAVTTAHTHGSASGAPVHPGLSQPSSNPKQGTLGALKSTFTGLSALAGLRPAQAKRG